MGHFGCFGLSDETQTLTLSLKKTILRIWPPARCFTSWRTGFFKLPNAASRTQPLGQVDQCTAVRQLAWRAAEVKFQAERSVGRENKGFAP